MAAGPGAVQFNGGSGAIREVVAVIPEDGPQQEARPAQVNRRAHRTPRRNRSVRFSLSEEEHALVASAASGERLAVGAYAARAVLNAARGSVQPQYALLRESLAIVMHASGQARRIGANLNQAVAALHSGEASPQLRWYAEAAARTVEKLDELADDVCRRLP